MNKIETDPNSTTTLLISDMDDTLTGDDDAILELIRTVSDQPQLEIVINSSRPAESIDQTLEEKFQGLEPLAVITAMGTEIRIRGNFLLSWNQHLGAWPREQLATVMENEGYEAHAEEYQTAYKASYVVPQIRWEAAAELLHQTGIPFELTRSGSSDFDITVPGAGKEKASIFLAEHLGYSRSQVIVAGDSGNDLKMFNAFERGIVVGNAREELRERVNKSRSYQATAAHAAGVLEGLKYYGVIGS